jgi:DNA-binding NarL/FixJ family response regulator
MGDVISSVGEREPLVVRRALIVEDDAFARTLIGHVLESAGFETRQCTSSAEAIDAFDAFDPDVLVTDIQLGAPPNGVQLAGALAQRAPYLGIVLISNFPSIESSGLGPSAPPGAAFLHKREIESFDLLLHAVESALDDSAPQFNRPADIDRSPLAGLSPTQMDTLRQIALGRSNAEIARQRATSLRSVERLVSRLFDALGVSGDPSGSPRVRAARIYIDVMGIPSEEP